MKLSPRLSLWIPKFQSQVTEWTDHQYIQGTQFIVPEQFKSRSIELGESFASYIPEYDFNAMLTSAQGDYLYIKSPYETWADGFVQDLHDLIDLDTGLNLLHGLGFVNMGDKDRFVYEVHPALNSPMSLSKNWDTPLIYGPYTPIVYNLEVIRSHEMQVPQFDAPYPLRMALFNLNYHSTLFSILGFEPHVRSRIIKSRTQPALKFKAEWLDLYQEAVKSKEELWTKSKWSLVYWKWMLRRLRRPNTERSTAALGD